MGPGPAALRTLQVLSAPGIGSELMLCPPVQAHGYLLYWLPAMGMPARKYQPLADALAEHGLGMALHEWRGIGSSNLRAARGQDWGYRELLIEDLPAGIARARRACPGARLLLGGHSLGGQLACLQAGMNPDPVHGMVLVASGTPYWRMFAGMGIALRVAFGLLPWITRMCGYYPGRRLGFAGNEARRVIEDWAHSGRNGRYAARGLDTDLEQGMERIRAPVLGLRMQDDWLCPAGSMRCLLEKMPGSPSEMHALEHEEIGARAGHFEWMRAPEAVAMRIAQWTQRLA